MRTYISEKSQIYVQWGWLTLGIPLYSLFTIGAIYDFVFLNKPGSLLGIFMLTFTTVLISFYVFKTNLLLLDKEKIVLKILRRELTYNIEDFEGVSDSFKLKFKDGKAFRFIIPKGRNWYFEWAFSKEKKIVYYNDLIREIIETHSANERDAIENN